MKCPKFLLVSALLAIAGCSSSSHQTEALTPAPLPDFERRVDFTSKWSQQVGNGADGYFVKFQIAANEDRVYSASRSGDVSAFELPDGKERWDIDLDIHLLSGPVSNEQMVWVGSSEGDVIALNADTGQEAWRAKVSSEVIGLSDPVGGKIVVRCVDGSTHALNAETGKLVWIDDRPLPPLTLRGMSKPVIYKDVVIIGLDDGKIVALNIDDGQPVWVSRVSLGKGKSQIERIVDVDGDIAVDRDTVFAVTYQGHLAALSYYGGRQIWEREASSFTGIEVDGSAVYFSDSDGSVWAIDRLSGAALWKQSALKNRRLSRPLSFSEYLVVGDFEGYLHVLDKQSGEFLGRFRAGSDEILIAPTIVKNQLLALNSAGLLKAFQLPE